MFGFLKPQDDRFYALFERQAACIVKGAKQLKDMLQNYTDPESKARGIKDTEHECDKVTQEIITELNKTFVTPLDREDIHNLATSLDDILDEIEGVSSRMIMMTVAKPTSEEIAMADIIIRATEEIEQAIQKLKKPIAMREFCERIKRYEHEADEISRRMIRRLFEKEENVKELIKWKELYGRLESTADACEDVANIIDGIVVKHA